MRSRLLLLFILVSLGVGAFLACQNEVGTAETGSLTLRFDNVVGNQDLALGTVTYQNAAGEPFTVTKFNYFVSNFRLIKADGTDYVLPQANNYFLIQEDKPASQSFTLTGIPGGMYTGISFLIGVDSLRSLADISQRTGVLDPGLGTHEAMYWEWNSGYIFLKLEGTSAAAPASQNNLFFYHIGGFGGGYNGKKTINNLRTVTIPFNGNTAQIAASNKPRINLIADVLNVFNGSTTLRIAQHSSVMFEDYSTNIANNYTGMIRYKDMQNQ
ncbi:MbnP family protein [Spirosoma panaciterrae]|uniref:MbnP family protein n=1 Tax=Spirosoma panaciterrae TaxID=496058 RepID=UPI0003749404|nr:MbnP family protein [Spirosoma panaciterrae]